MKNGVIVGKQEQTMDVFVRNYTLIAGFYDHQANKKEFIDNIIRIGDYTNRFMHGEIVNVFNLSHGKEIVNREGISVVILNGCFVDLECKVRNVLEKDGEIEKWEDMHTRFRRTCEEKTGFPDDIKEMIDSYQDLSEFQDYIYLGPGEIRDDAKFIDKIPAFAEENDLYHLAFVPLYNTHNSIEDNLIFFLNLEPTSSILPKKLILFGDRLDPKEAVKSLEILNILRKQ